MAEWWLAQREFCSPNPPPLQLVRLQMTVIKNGKANIQQQGKYYLFIQ
jgi:hypothetical protein